MLSFLKRLIPLSKSDKIHLLLKLGKVDFIEMGASDGRYFRQLLLIFGHLKTPVKIGIGVDNDPVKVLAAQKKGFRCILGDITNLELGKKKVRFCSMSHVLEHLPNLESAELAIKSAIEISKDFIFIQGPFFDEDKYLESKKLRFFWSNWVGHPLHLSSDMLIGIFDKLGVNDYRIYVRIPIKDSSDPSIHSLKSRRNQFDFDPKVHPPKAQVTFTRPLWREIVAFARLSDNVSWEELEKVHDGMVLLASKDQGKILSLKTSK